MGTEPSPTGTERLHPRPSPGDGVGQGSGPGLGWRARGSAGLRGGILPGGCPGRIPATPRSAARPRGSPRQRPLRVSPFPPTLREGTAGGWDVGDARTWAGASCRSAASSRRRSRARWGSCLPRHPRQLFSLIPVSQPSSTGPLSALTTCLPLPRNLGTLLLPLSLMVRRRVCVLESGWDHTT